MEYYRYNTDGTFDTITLDQLQAVLTYGALGGVVLLFLPLIAITFYVSHQAKGNRDSGVLENTALAIVRIYIYYSLFMGAISIFIVGLIAMGSSYTDPAYGIDLFFHTDWFNKDLITQLKNGKMGDGGTVQLSQGISLLGILSVFRLAYIFMLFLFVWVMALMGSLSTLSHYKKQQDGSVIEMIAVSLGAGIISVLVLYGLLELYTSVLNWILVTSDYIHSSSKYTGDIDILRDFASPITIGIEAFNK